MAQDPVSTMQKTGWTNFSSFLLLSGLWKDFTYGWMWSLEGDHQPFSSKEGHFWHSEEHPKKQSGDPRGSLILTSEKAFFCTQKTVSGVLKCKGYEKLSKLVMNGSEFSSNRIRVEDSQSLYIKRVIVVCDKIRHSSEEIISNMPQNLGNSSLLCKLYVNFMPRGLYELATFFEHGFDPLPPLLNNIHKNWKIGTLRHPLRSKHSRKSWSGRRL